MLESELLQKKIKELKEKVQYEKEIVQYERARNIMLKKRLESYTLK